MVIIAQLIENAGTAPKLVDLVNMKLLLEFTMVLEYMDQNLVAFHVMELVAGLLIIF